MSFELYTKDQLKAFERLKVTFGGWFPCPCCFYFGLSECPPGTFENCRICGWEDDRLQFVDPNYPSGANRLSLKQARHNVELSGTKTGVMGPRPSLEVPRARPRVSPGYWLAPLTKVTGGGGSPAAVGRLLHCFGVTAAILEAFIEQNFWLLRDSNIYWERVFLTQENRASYLRGREAYLQLSESEVDAIIAENSAWSGGPVWGVHRGRRYSLHEAEAAWRNQ